MNCTCEDCKEQDATVQVRQAMTAYAWDGKGENPNRDMMLCDTCWDSYRTYWQDMWNEYYMSQGAYYS